MLSFFISKLHLHFLIKTSLIMIKITSPKQFDKLQTSLTILDKEVDNLIRTELARNKFNVSGDGLTVAVIDTGLRITHLNFKEKVLKELNFTNDGPKDDANDKLGHGTNVSGIIVANGNVNTGIAPKSSIIPL